MTKPFDPTKPVQTRTGRKARIVCTDVKSEYSIIAVITKPDGAEYAATYKDGGRSSSFCELMPSDLINVPERTSRWANIYAPQFTGRSTRERCGETISEEQRRLCVVEIIYEDGVPVDAKLHKDGE